MFIRHFNNLFYYKIHNSDPSLILISELLWSELGYTNLNCPDYLKSAILIFFG